jgi:hypothetical protein
MLESITCQKKSWRYSKIFIGFIIVFSFVVPSVVFSVSFGAFLKKDEATLHRGETGVFEIFFYSRSDESAGFVLSLTQSPQGFDIGYPDSFDLSSPDLKDEFILISGDYVKGKVVKVIVVALNDASPGEHAIMMKAVSNGLEGGGSTLGVKTEKMFLMKVNVAGATSGSIPPADETGEDDNGDGTTTTTSVTTTTQPSQNRTTPYKVQGEEDEFNKFLIMIAVVLMVVFLILVYLNYNSR